VAAGAPGWRGAAWGPLGAWRLESGGWRWARWEGGGRRMWQLCGRVGRLCFRVASLGATGRAQSGEGRRQEDGQEGAIGVSLVAAGLSLVCRSGALLAGDAQATLCVSRRQTGARLQLSVSGFRAAKSACERTFPPRANLNEWAAPRRLSSVSIEQRRQSVGSAVLLGPSDWWLAVTFWLEILLANREAVSPASSRLVCGRSPATWPRSTMAHCLR